MSPALGLLHLRLVGDFIKLSYSAFPQAGWFLQGNSQWCWDAATIHLKELRLYAGLQKDFVCAQL
jgi:hypothetical protein